MDLTTHLSTLLEPGLCCDKRCSMCSLNENQTPESFIGDPRPCPDLSVYGKLALGRRGHLNLGTVSTVS
jgi:hypothetical protein